MTTESLYIKSNIKRLPELAKIVPESFKAFFEFDKLALADGLISKKTKECIAIAVAHVTGCPYCIDAHVTSAKTLGVTKEELGEVIMVATALKAGSALAHGFNAMNAFIDSESESEDLYKRSNVKHFKDLSNAVPEAVAAFQQFDRLALKESFLSKKDKELIAVAVAHVTGCAYCIDGHTKNSKRLGVSLEELGEAIMVATAVKAGAALAHSVNALNAYDPQEVEV